jgi:gliding motility-associated lipoprotein GldD
MPYANTFDFFSLSMNELLLRLTAAILLCMLLTCCNSTFTPKPRGYAKTSFPRHQYQLFNEPGYPYQFEYPVYATVLKDSTFFEDKAENPWWINIDFATFDSRIYISYKALPANDFSKMVNDAYNLTYKHSYKASFIEDSIFRNANNVSGVMFKVGGNAATASQFYLTDSIHHFLRGALYFDAPPNEDSLKPVNDFLVEDLKHLINTFQWKK